MIMKKKCALYASILVKDGMVVGLGGGSTIQYLIDYVKDKDIQVVTPSAKTALKAQKEGLTVLNTQYVDHVDIAFDGCDEVDSHLNALKSGGGIHTQEKLLRPWPMNILYWLMKLNFMRLWHFKCLL